MKTLIALFFLTLTCGTFAASNSNYLPEGKIAGRIEHVFCGEMDPFVVGDVCVVFIERGSNRLAVMLPDMDTFVSQYEDLDALVGQPVQFERSKLTKIFDRDITEVLRRYDSTYFYTEIGSNEDLIIGVSEAITNYEGHTYYGGVFYAGEYNIFHADDFFQMDKLCFKGSFKDVQTLIEREVETFKMILSYYDGELGSIGFGHDVIYLNAFDAETNKRNYFRVARCE